ncbi:MULTISPECIES: SRPBCC family protein [unclassified Geodermatophilus]|uniref:SRPBCC family protein n=1 Tax=unclassified Geodermatophilus TaxID=2637632 RepID=UPI003EEA3321
MVTLTSRVVVPAPVEATAALVLDLTRDREWRPAVVSMQVDPPGPARVGQRAVERLRFAGLTFVTPTEVVEAGPTSLGFEGGTRQMTVRGRRTVEPRPDGGSLVTEELTVLPHGLFRLVNPLLTPGYRWLQDADVARIPAAVAAQRV